MTDIIPNVGNQILLVICCYETCEGVELFYLTRQYNLQHICSETNRWRCTLSVVCGLRNGSLGGGVTVANWRADDT